MGGKAFEIKTGDRLLLAVTKLKGRGQISLDGQVLFQGVDLESAEEMAARILPEGDHVVDLTASDFRGNRYDMRITVKVQKDGQPESLLTIMHIISSGKPNDTSGGETLRFMAVRRENDE